MFLGHTTHLDLVKSFNEGLERLDLSKLVQMSMDGPNTNLKFLQELKKERAELELSSLIDLQPPYHSWSFQDWFRSTRLEAGQGIEGCV